MSINVRKAAAPDKRSYRVNFARYNELAPNHLPKISLEQSISELKDGLEAMGFRDRAFRESAHVRLNVLRGLVAKGALDKALRWK